jgi:hypothetical protein
MKVGDLVRYKDSIREDTGIILELHDIGESIFGRRVIVMTTTGVRSYSEKQLEILNGSR